MDRVLLLCSLALFVAGGLCDPIRHAKTPKQGDKTFLQRQVEIANLFHHIHEPICFTEQTEVLNTQKFDWNVEHYSNVTAVKIYVDITKCGLIPRGVPFTFLEGSHKFEAVTLFHVLFSAKDYQTFYKTAVWARQHVNEFLFVHVLTVVVLNRHDTQGIVIPPLYEIFPSFFNNAEIMTTAQRINTHGHRWVEHYPHTLVHNKDVVIQANYTFWPYYTSQQVLVDYFTHDHGLNTWYYNQFLMYPSWLGGKTVHLVNDRRGEWFWFMHKQLMTRYYMERLSNGLPEITELSWNSPVVEGVTSGLVYPNGIPFPVRQNYFDIEEHPEYTELLTKIQDYEHRIRDVIDKGYVEMMNGAPITLRTPQAIDIIGRLIESNVDSPDAQYFRDFISLWKTVLGNSVWHHSTNHDANLVVPGVLDHYHTALRDPAFYMLWKRVLAIFDQFFHHLPLYKRHELALPSVEITNVDVGKMVTYFENSYVNISNYLYLENHEAEHQHDHVSVLVQRPRLNHKVFTVKVNVKCADATRPVLVRFFLAPKYNSEGHEIPIHENYENFLQLDEFVYELKQGENEIHRDSTENVWMIDDWHSYHDIRTSAYEALHGSGKFELDSRQQFDGFPSRLLLPKGRVGGMPFIFLVHITEHKTPQVTYGTGFDPTVSLGLGSGARHLTDLPMGFPVDRPLHTWQIVGLKNLVMKDVMIHHKHTAEMTVTHLE